MADKAPQSKPPEISEATRKLWAQAEQRFQESEQAKSYLQSTGKYSSAELDKMDIDDLKAEIADEADRQLQASDSRVDPKTVGEWVKAADKFDDREAAREFLRDTGHYGDGEINGMSDAQLRAAIDTNAQNALLGHDSAVDPANTKLWVEAEERYRQSVEGTESDEDAWDSGSDSDDDASDAFDRGTDFDFGDDSTAGLDFGTDDGSGGSDDASADGGAGADSGSGGVTDTEGTPDSGSGGDAGDGSAPGSDGGDGSSDGAGGESGLPDGSEPVRWTTVLDENGDPVENGEDSVATDVTVYETPDGEYVHADGTPLTEEEVEAQGLDSSDSDEEDEEGSDDSDSGEDDGEGSDDSDGGDDSGATESSATDSVGYTPDPDGQTYRIPSEDELNASRERMHARNGWDTDPPEEGEDTGDVIGPATSRAQQLKPVDPVDDEEPVHRGELVERVDWNGNAGSIDPVPDEAEAGEGAFGAGASADAAHADVAHAGPAAAFGHGAPDDAGPDSAPFGGHGLEHSAVEFDVPINDLSAADASFGVEPIEAPTVPDSDELADDTSEDDADDFADA